MVIPRSIGAICSALDSDGFKSYVKRRLNEVAGDIQKNGIVAGQSIATFAMEYIWNRGGPVNDVDVFVHVSEDAACKIETSGEEDVLPKLRVKPGFGPSSFHRYESSSYGVLSAINNSVYRVVRSKNIGIVNHIFISFEWPQVEIHYNSSFDVFRRNFHEISARTVIGTFDLSSVQIAYVPKIDRIVYTENFARFLSTRQIEPTHIHTPARSYLRAMKKELEYDEMVWSSKDDFLDSAVLMWMSFVVLSDILKNENENRNTVDFISSLRTPGRIFPVVGKNNYEKFSEIAKKSGFFRVDPVVDVHDLELWGIWPNEKAVDSLIESLSNMGRNLSFDFELSREYKSLMYELERLTEAVMNGNVSHYVEKIGGYGYGSYAEEFLWDIEHKYFSMKNASRKRRHTRKTFFKTHYSGAVRWRSDSSVEAFLPLNFKANGQQIQIIDRGIRKLCKDHTSLDYHIPYMLDPVFSYWGYQKALDKLQSWLSKPSYDLNVDIGIIENIISSRGSVSTGYTTIATLFPLMIDENLGKQVVDEILGGEKKEVVEVEKYVSGNIIVEELTSALELSDEGATMRHCVAGYIPQVASGKTIILRVRTNGENSRRNERWTVEVRPRIRDGERVTVDTPMGKMTLVDIWQFKGFGNSTPVYENDIEAIGAVVDALMNSSFLVVGFHESIGKKSGDTLWYALSSMWSGDNGISTDISFSKNDEFYISIA